MFAESQSSPLSSILPQLVNDPASDLQGPRNRHATGLGLATESELLRTVLITYESRVSLDVGKTGGKKWFSKSLNRVSGIVHLLAKA